YFAGAGDVINDADGKGWINMLITNADSSQGYVSLDVFQSDYKTEFTKYSGINYSYNEVSKDLIVSQEGSTAKGLVIENFTMGQFGIGAGWSDVDEIVNNSYWLEHDTNGDPKPEADCFLSYDPWWLTYNPWWDRATGTDVSVVVETGASDDDVFTNAGDDDVFTNAGNDVVYSGAGNDTVHGGSGVDQLFGEAGDDQLYGDAGIDHILGGVGNDIIEGGADPDYLEGGIGDDTYIINYGDVESLSTVERIKDIEGNDTLIFDDSFNRSLISYSVQDSDLIITINTLGMVKGIFTQVPIGYIAITDWFVDSAYKIENVVFTDGTVYSAHQLELFAGAITNNAPVLDNSILDQVTAEDGTFSFTVPADTFSDPDVDDALSYSATLADDTALPSWLSFDDTTRTFSGAPVNDDVGVIEVKVTATDGSDSLVTDTFSLTVNNTNDAPTVSTPIAGQTAIKDQAFSFQIPANTFTDVDVGDTLSYSATLLGGDALPGWLSFDPATGEFGGVPDNAAVGDIQINVTATDSNGAAVSDEFGVSVVASANHAPVVNRDYDIPYGVVYATRGSSFSYQVSPDDIFSDSDVGDSLTLSASMYGAPLNTYQSFLSFDAATNTFTFNSIPDNDSSDEFDIDLTATDSYGLKSDHFYFTIGVLDNYILDQEMAEDAVFSYTFPAYAFNEDLIEYNLSATLADNAPLPTWLSFDAATRTFSGTPVNDDVGVTEVKIAVTDGGGLLVADTFSLTVNNTNDAPTVSTSIAGQYATKDQAFSFQIPADTFTDVDVGDTLTYSATLLGGDALPGWLSFDPVTGEFDGVPDNAAVGEIQIEVTATDSGGAAVSDIFSVTVTSVSVNNAPVLDT
ncbi:MAG: hypothetical protein GY779_07495, partial [Gammaproteobacteria bacterium]|nr:hypothetical protein [Gammaproteobacteria bacterium]